MRQQKEVLFLPFAMQIEGLRGRSLREYFDMQDVEL